MSERDDYQDRKADRDEDDYPDYPIRTNRPNWALEDGPD